MLSLCAAAVYEAQEPTFACDDTVRSEALDADVVEKRRTVHSGTRVGLG